MNPRPLGYEPNELPDCSTPRQSVTRWPYRAVAALRKTLTVARDCTLAKPVFTPNRSITPRNSSYCHLLESRSWSLSRRWSRDCRLVRESCPRATVRARCGDELLSGDTGSRPARPAYRTGRLAGGGGHAQRVCPPRDQQQAEPDSQGVGRFGGLRVDDACEHRQQVRHGASPDEFLPSFMARDSPAVETRSGSQRRATSCTSGSCVDA